MLIYDDAKKRPSFSMFFSRHYSLSRSQTIFYQANKLYQKKYSNLAASDKEKLESLLENCQLALDGEDKPKASSYAQDLELFIKEHFNNTYYEVTKELILTLVLTFFFAIVFRQMIFEPYEIPTGSMRPTFLEEDKVIASKTSFSLNIPCHPNHFYFLPQSVKRGDFVVFTSEGLNIPDNDTRYFYLFPAKKRVVKRCMGLPGDKIYFYGGKVYGFDKNGLDISQELSPIELQNLEHIPFLSFEGLYHSDPKENALVFEQMGMPVAKISYDQRPKSYLNLHQRWVETSPSPKKEETSLKDLWGMGNYACCRLISKEKFQQLTAASPFYQQDSKALLYIELSHTPFIRLKNSIFEQGSPQLLPGLHTEKTFIPVHQKHLEKLFQSLYTARFFITNEQALAYRMGKPDKNYSHEEISFKGVEDGVYEFYFGKAYKISQSWNQLFNGGKREELAPNHPIYKPSIINLSNLFNYGISFSTHPILKQKTYRYAYFKNGSLNLMGHAIYSPDDPVLQQFIATEKHKEQNAKPAFLDAGAPYKNGKLNKELLEQFGLKVPANHYLLLGDNHAQSSDSREFGFLPETHLRGTPVFRFWPLASRFGFTQQHIFSPSLLTCLVWAFFGLTFLLYGYFHRKKLLSARFERLP